jgi:hypothetical protein
MRGRLNKITIITWYWFPLRRHFNVIHSATIILLYWRFRTKSVQFFKHLFFSSLSQQSLSLAQIREDLRHYHSLICILSSSEELNKTVQKSLLPNTVIADATHLQAPYNKLFQKVVNYVCIIFATLRCTWQFFLKFL